MRYDVSLANYFNIKSLTKIVFPIVKSSTANLNVDNSGIPDNH